MARAALLIVTADDFGLTTAISDGIVEGFRRGIVTGASLMPTGRAFEHAAALAHENHELDIGVHLTLDEERPVLSGLKTLTGPDGRFHARGTLVRRLVTRRIDLAEVEAEWKAQILRVLEAGLEPGFVNSHGHIHAFPTLLPIAARLALRHGITAVRKPVEPIRRAGVADLARAALVSRSARVAFGRLTERIGTTERFYGLAESGRLDRRRIEEIVGDLQPGLAELMTHPGHADEETRRDYGRWGYLWEQELQALIDFGPLPGAVPATFRRLFP